jgi:hypothetical protein
MSLLKKFGQYVRAQRANPDPATICPKCGKPKVGFQLAKPGTGRLRPGPNHGDHVINQQFESREEAGLCTCEEGD